MSQPPREIMKLPPIPTGSFQPMPFTINAAECEALVQNEAGPPEKKRLLQLQFATPGAISAFFVDVETARNLADLFTQFAAGGLEVARAMPVLPPDLRDAAERFRRGLNGS